MSHRRFQSRARIAVEHLEARNAPVASPLGQGVLQILGTYGQYQDVPVNVPGPQGGRFDNSIHLHEGIDIVVAQPGVRVNAIVAGRVDAVFRDLRDPEHSFVVIRDGAPNNLQNLGINYKHVIPSPNLAVGAFVAEGDFIGTVAPNAIIFFCSVGT